MNTGILELSDVKLSVGFVDYVELPVEYELEGVYEMSGGYAEHYSESLVGEEFGYLAVDKEATYVVFSINDEEVEIELTPELVFEINNYLLELDVEPESLR